MPFSSYMRSELGTAVIEPGPEVEAGSHVALTITYTAGKFGIDDTGALKFSWRTASDSGKPQFTDPKAPNYTTVEASNGAALHIEYNRNNIRPWVSTIFVRVMDGFLRAGERIVLRIGDTRQGSRGYRIQTCCDDDFQFKTFVDAFSTYDFVALEESPTLRLVPGPPVKWKAYTPTLLTVGEPFRLCILPEDRWGNPSNLASETFRLVPSMAVAGLPEQVTVAPGDEPVVIENLRVASPGDLVILLERPDGTSLGRSNPMRVVETTALHHYWGDLHGQSNETVGTNTVADYFRFARDKAFVDMVAHQGNDFQIDDALWAEINRLAAAYDEPGRFVALPAYEWSGNTGMGGDRNVYFASEGRPIRRSSRVLLDETAGVENDCHRVTDLFEALQGEDAVVIAHVGGRYADLSVGHDGRIERAVEIHSCWGTFEWLLFDAFDLGHRVGVVCHSDDHKGRPGAAYPGAATFGAIGGLTCYAMARLDRTSLFEALRARRHYGTTGTRLFLDVRASFDGGAERYADDPKLGPTTKAPCTDAVMGEIVRTDATEVKLSVSAVGSAPIERLTVFNGKRPVAVWKPFGAAELGRRVRIVMEGAKYRGRSREVYWRGLIRLEGNRFTDLAAANLFNVDKPLRAAADGSEVAFDTVTTGNFAAIDLWLEKPDAGELVFVSDVVEARLKVADIGLEDSVHPGAGLGVAMRAFRLPDEGVSREIDVTSDIPLERGRDNPLFVRLTQEDGHQAWSSPIYVIDES